MAQTGTLIVKVYTSNGFIPIPGAAVIVVGGAPKPELLAIQFTDESGLTQPITVETPALSNSQQPGQPNGWTDLSLLVEQPEYEQVIIRGLQVFPGEESVQNIQLIPLAQFPEVWDRAEEVQITPQDL